MQVLEINLLRKTLQFAHDSVKSKLCDSPGSYMILYSVLHFIISRMIQFGLKVSEEIFALEKMAKLSLKHFKQLVGMIDGSVYDTCAGCVSRFVGHGDYCNPLTEKLLQNLNSDYLDQV